MPGFKLYSTRQMNNARNINFLQNCQLDIQQVYSSESFYLFVNPFNSSFQMLLHLMSSTALNFTLKMIFFNRRIFVL